jgi:hypothetical protein
MLTPSPPVLESLRSYNNKIKKARISIRARNLAHIHTHILVNVSEDLGIWRDKARVLLKNPAGRKHKNVSMNRSFEIKSKRLLKSEKRKDSEILPE